MSVVGVCDGTITVAVDMTLPSVSTMLPATTRGAGRASVSKRTAGAIWNQGIVLARLPCRRRERLTIAWRTFPTSPSASEGVHRDLACASGWYKTPPHAKCASHAIALEIPRKAPKSRVQAPSARSAAKTRCSSSRPTVRPSHERIAWLKPTAGLTRVEGTGPHWLRGTRRTPKTSSAPKAQAPRGGGRGGRPVAAASQGRRCPKGRGARRRAGAGPGGSPARRGCGWTGAGPGARDGAW